MRRWFITVLFVLMALVSCQREGERENPETDSFRSVFIYVGMGYNNLSGNIESDLEELMTGIMPEKSRDVAIVAFIHTQNNYSPAQLLRIYRKDGHAATEVLKTYPEDFLAATPEGLNTILTDVLDMMPSSHYGMLMSSHGTGWLPSGYSAYGEHAGSLSELQLQALQAELESGPLTKSVGQQNTSGSSYITLDIPQLADAIPMHLDYMIFDACFMGGVEVAWELRNVCDRLVVSPAEILAEGMVYASLSMNLLGSSEPELEAFCREYFNYYDSQTGTSRSATISLVDCTRLDPLADAFSAIVSRHRSALDGLDTRGIQRYFRSDNIYYFFYDLRDFAEALGATDAELGQLDEALDQCIEYHAETEIFIGTLALENCCGLSSYIPLGRLTELNSYYSTLGWNLAVGLVD